MTWGMVAVAGATVVSSLVGSNASKQAAKGQIDAANSATDLQRQEWNQNQANQAPFLQAGQAAEGQLGAMTQQGFQYGGTADPSFQFSLQQGQDAMNRATANKGGVLSGSSLGSLNSYSQNVANQGYQGAFNCYQSQIGNLMSIAGLGQNSGAQVGAQGNQAMGNIGNLMTGAANAGAAGTVGQANAWMGGMNNMANTFNQANMLNQLATMNGGLGLNNYRMPGIADQMSNLSPGYTGATPLDY